MTLPKLPNITLTTLGKAEPGAAEFLRINRSKYKATYPDGSESKEFLHDIVERKCTDAVVIICYDNNGIYLRSAVRPSIYARFGDGNLWELPAGLVEPKESFAEAASRETLEELGFDIRPDQFRQLGSIVYPAYVLSRLRSWRHPWRV